MNIDQFWNKASAKTEKVTVKGLGEITIKELSATDIEDMRVHEGKELNMAGHVVIRGMLNDEGTRMFKDEDLDKLLSDLAMSTLSNISNAVLTLSGIGEDDAPKGK